VAEGDAFWEGDAHASGPSVAGDRKEEFRL
jgi:hypothetical protein